MKFSLNSNAKINIGLNVTGVLPNGYHLLDMVMIPISLTDKLEGEIFEEDGELEITTNKPSIPTGKENILWKIYDKFYKRSGFTKKRVKIYLEKVIPHERIIAFRMFFRQSYIFVHVECYHILEGNDSFLIQVDQSFIHAQRR